MTRGDRIVVLVVVIGILTSFPLVSFASSQHADTVVIDSPGGHTRVSLAHDGRYVIEGRNGRVVVEVTDRAAKCVYAACPDQVCVRSGAARAGRPVVCAPNGVSVSLASEDGGGLDAVTR